MDSICLYFQVHQPFRIKRYTFFELGHDHFYEDEHMNRQIIDRVSEKCYLPANALLLDLIKASDKKFKVAFSLSGVFLDQLEQYRPDVLASFVELAETGCVEFLGETYYHSLAYFYSKDEFDRQVKLHSNKIKSLFGKKPVVFRNTELIYNNELAQYVEKAGFKGVLSEGVDWYLNGRTPNVAYKAPNTEKIITLLKNYKLSDDIAFRFGSEHWPEHPLTSEKYLTWIKKEKGDCVNLFMDYETFGEHKWKDSGIFEFMRHFVVNGLAGGLNFITPSEFIAKNKKTDHIYDVHNPISWADAERDLSAWNGNTMQIEALDKIYALESAVKESKDKDLLTIWSKLLTSDHYYYMSTKSFSDGQVHAYFSPFDSPYDSYIYYMNIISDLEITLERKGIKLN